MRFISKILGSWFIIVALVTFMADFTAASASQIGFKSTSIGQHWQALNKSSFEKTQVWVTGKLPLVWDTGIATILEIPTWAIMFLIGVALFWISRKRKRIQIFAN